MIDEATSNIDLKTDEEIQKELNSLGDLPSINTSLKFDDTDYIRDENNNIEKVIAPKTIEELEINFDSRSGSHLWLKSPLKSKGLKMKVGELE